MRQTQGERLSPLVALNLLCLDAPLVAIAWQQLFARSLLLPVSTAASVALFATAWLIYLVDRVADLSTLASDAPVSLRQRFARRNRMFFGFAITIALVADAIAIPHLDRTTLVAGATIGLFLLIYLGVNRFVSSIWRTVPVKELAIGVLFAAGVCVSVDGYRAIPLSLAAVFAALCALNCVSIAFWERELDVAQKRSSIATTFPTLRHAPLVGCALLALFAVMRAQRLPFLCIAVSGALLAILNLRSLQISRDTRTALADVVLLTPLAALAFAS